MGIPTRQEYNEEFGLTSVIVWSIADGAFFKVNFPSEQVRSAEAGLGKLVTDPALIRVLQIVFMRFCLSHDGRPPDVMRLEEVPLVDFLYRRVSIHTPSGRQLTDCNLFFAKKRGVVAA